MMFVPNKCDTCPITAVTTCSLQALAYEKFGFEGMAKCEMRQDVERMLEAKKTPGAKPG